MIWRAVWRFCLLTAMVPGFVASSLGQTSCREATGTTIESGAQYTVYGVTLPVGEKKVSAMALIPKTQGELSAVVFSFSTLSGTEPAKTVEVMPEAVQLAKEGKTAIVLQRKLTWPEIDASVGTMHAAVLCAQQWLAAHAKIEPTKWLFVGPISDKPTFDQAKAVGDKGTMSFQWAMAVGGPNEFNTERILQRGSLDVRIVSGGIDGF